ncbi:glycoside hydrolase family 130 protein [Candidatus Omnitrophota bacterium]
MKRNVNNPLISPHDVIPSQRDLKVVGVFNAAAIEHHNQTVLILRIAEEPVIRDAEEVVGVVFDHNDKKVVMVSFDKNDPNINYDDPRVIKTQSGVFLTTLSHFRRAWSDDGVTFTVDPQPTFLPLTEYETYGVEDPRLTFIDDKFVLNYTGVSSYGITTLMATSNDLLTFKREGIIFPPDNRDVTIFPEKINGSCVALHRPCSAEFGPPSIWFATSGNLIQWGNHQCIMRPSSELWEAKKIGGGAVPLKTREGWLVIYHGVSFEDVYSLGAVLLDYNDPTKVKARLKDPLLIPEMNYEKNGFFGNVVFTCGAILRNNGMIDVYYGASDEKICLSSIELEVLLKRLLGS